MWRPTNLNLKASLLTNRKQSPSPTAQIADESSKHGAHREAATYALIRQCAACEVLEVWDAPGDPLAQVMHEHWLISCGALRARCGASGGTVDSVRGSDLCRILGFAESSGPEALRRTIRLEYWRLTSEGKVSHNVL